MEALHQTLQYCVYIDTRIATQKEILFNACDKYAALEFFTQKAPDGAYLCSHADYMPHTIQTLATKRTEGNRSIVSFSGVF